MADQKSSGSEGIGPDGPRNKDRFLAAVKEARDADRGLIITQKGKMAGILDVRIDTVDTASEPVDLTDEVIKDSIGSRDPVAVAMGGTILGTFHPIEAQEALRRYLETHPDLLAKLQYGLDHPEEAVPASSLFTEMPGQQ